MRRLKIALAVAALLIAGAAAAHYGIAPIDGWPSEKPKAAEWPPCGPPFHCLARS